MEKIKNLLTNKLSREVIIYIIAGVATTAVDWLATFVFSLLGCTPTVSNTLAIVISIVFAYAVNSRMVFETKPDNVMTELKMFIGFVGARVLSSVIQIAGIYIFAEKLGFNQFIIKAILSVFVIVFNYVVSKLWIFRKEDNNG